MNYEVGSRVGDYEILKILGTGGMGCVYKVRSVISERVEAMKVLLPNLESDPELADRFMREIKMQASLDHPNIAALHTALRIDNQLVMLMEYVEGATLESMMKSGPVPIDRAVDYMTQVLAALSYAHARSIIHRDLKPANMMVTPGGLVKLMDFGIAKMTADRKLTQTGRTVGSLYYMSPEQINGAQNLDPRSDLYSLGVTLYEVATGVKPFEGDSEYSIMAAHLKNIPRPPIQISPKLPAALNEIILIALEKDPAKRFQTADAFRSALLTVLGPRQMRAAAPSPAAGVQTADPTLQTRTPAAAIPVSRPVTGRRALWLAIGALITLAVLVAVAIQIPKFRHTAAVNTPERNLPAEPATDIKSPTPMPVTDSAQPPLNESKPAEQSTITPPLLSGSQSKVSSSATQLPEQPLSTSRRMAAQTAKITKLRNPQLPAEPSSEVKAADVLREISRQLDLLDVRAGTVKSSLDNLKRQQEAMGLGLRADMAASAKRMDYYLNQTEAALKRADAEDARRTLNLAESEVSKLENFLGK
jgi:serine/threonine protein kinase